jgi:hypothetical protein
MASLGVAQTAADTTLTSAQILAVVERMQATGAVSADMAVTRGREDDVMNAALREAGGTSTVAVVGYTGYTGQYDAALIGGTTANNNPHWREGNSTGTVVWDPYGTGVVQFQPGMGAQSFVYVNVVPGG